ncbi:MAG: nuclear transport factor 2 family protein [Salinivirgaceae bacterium]|nr:nuclear transport factor 2 family protein [Salinivirgaceae bacterium]
MKKLFYVIFGLLLIACSSNTSKRTNEKIVKNVLNDFISAVEEKNFSALADLTHDDFVIYENGLVWNLEQFTMKLEEYENVGIKYKLKDLHIIVDKNTAHAQFHNQGTFNHPDTVIVLNFIESATFIKHKGNWQVQFYHSTHLK